jgi:hypothetical protein
MFMLWPGILAGLPCSEKGKWVWGWRLEAGDWRLGMRKPAKKTTSKSEKSHPLRLSWIFLASLRCSFDLRFSQVHLNLPIVFGYGAEIKEGNPLVGCPLRFSRSALLVPRPVV